MCFAVFCFFNTPLNGFDIFILLMLKCLKLFLNGFLSFVFLFFKPALVGICSVVFSCFFTFWFCSCPFSWFRLRSKRKVTKKSLKT